MQNLTNSIRKLLLILSIYVFLAANCFALVFPLDNTAQTDVIGDVQKTRVQFNQDFHDIARNYDVGYAAMQAANQQYNPKHPPLWYQVTVPTEFILPPAKRSGIVINLPEMRLYYYPPGEQEVYTYPIGIGQPGWETPTGKMNIKEKIPDPTWHVPKSIQAYLAAKGIQIADVIPPGKDNPLGKFALRLSNPSYLIHGTNNVDTIGMRSSSGCIRLYPKDISELFSLVTINTPVDIIDIPYKIGWKADDLYLQAYAPLKEDNADTLENDLQQVTTEINAEIKDHPKENIDINWDKVYEVIANHSGIPQVIGVAHEI